ncbi:hypothetical protein KIN20_004901 [Parelaphostrongylus tenuis]|uniref:Uncharacterized protein n=1 Tax=Parelaphostrongylus tenuis TaxID=148309 RepID=A0AAD5QFJ3_PARTN|nr:hypothetical protein KIN20_004901 [Parelaphostrongylus tenuis]
MGLGLVHTVGSLAAITHTAALEAAITHTAALEAAITHTAATATASPIPEVTVACCPASATNLVAGSTTSSRIARALQVDQDQVDYAEY